MPSAIAEHGEPGPDGRYDTDVLVRLSAAERAALGCDPQAGLGLVQGRMLAEIGEFSHAVAWALVLLRSIEHDGGYGADTEDDLAHLRGIIATLERRLIPALSGIRDAAVRRHAHLGGSHGQLAAAMGVPRSTAQTRTRAVVDRDPTAWERWATALGTVALPRPGAVDGDSQDYRDLREVVRAQAEHDYEPHQYPLTLAQWQQSADYAALDLLADQPPEGGVEANARDWLFGLDDVAQKAAVRAVAQDLFDQQAGPQGV